MAEEVKAKAAPKKTAAAKPAAEKAVAAPKAEAKKPEAKNSGKQLKVTLVRSTIGCLQKQKRTVEALGLKKIRSSRVHEDNACIRGMIFIVKHLVKVEEV